MFTGGDDAAGQRGDHLLGALETGAIGGLGGGGAQMRRHHHVGVSLEQGVLGDRLGGKHIERGSGHLARVQSVLERGVVDQAASGHVENAHPVSHLGELAGVHPTFGLGRLGQVDRDEVGLGAHLIR